MSSQHFAIDDRYAHNCAVTEAAMAQPDKITVDSMYRGPGEPLSCDPTYLRSQTYKCAPLPGRPNSGGLGLRWDNDLGCYAEPVQWELGPNYLKRALLRKNVAV